MFWTRCCSERAVEMEASCWRAIMASDVAGAVPFLEPLALPLSAAGSSFSLFGSELSPDFLVLGLEMLGYSDAESCVRRLYFLGAAELVTATREKSWKIKIKIQNHKERNKNTE